MLHCLHILLGGFRRFIVGIVELIPREEFGRRVAVCTSAAGSDLLHEFRVKLAAANGLHHGEMLEVVVRLKEGVASEELNQNASYAPDVAGKAPAKLQDDLRSTIVPC